MRIIRRWLAKIRTIWDSNDHPILVCWLVYIVFGMLSVWGMWTEFSKQDTGGIVFGMLVTMFYITAALYVGRKLKFNIVKHTYNYSESDKFWGLDK